MWRMGGGTATGGAVYGLGFFGALVYYIQTAPDFLAGLLGLVKALLWPGFLVQKITTIEPDDAQLEVALAALSVAAKREQAPDAPATGERAFPDFGAVVAG